MKLVWSKAVISRCNQRASFGTYDTQVVNCNSNLILLYFR